MSATQELNVGTLSPAFLLLHVADAIQDPERSLPPHRFRRAAELLEKLSRGLRSRGLAMSVADPTRSERNRLHDATLYSLARMDGSVDLATRAIARFRHEYPSLHELQLAVMQLRRVLSAKRRGRIRTILREERDQAAAMLRELIALFPYSSTGCI